MWKSRYIVKKFSKNSLDTTKNILINKLSSIQWFKDSVRDIRGFKIEDWSDFTDIVRG